jgi:membrane-associated HD superfamily phosphohydrolase
LFSSDATWQETETKRVFVGRLFPKLESDNKGAQVIKQMAVSLSDQSKFPDLEGWEDAQTKIQSAKETIAALRHYLNTQNQKADDAKTREETRKAAHQRMQETITRQAAIEATPGCLKNERTSAGRRASGAMRSASRSPFCNGRRAFPVRFAWLQTHSSGLRSGA